MAEPFAYALLRVVPDLDRGECLNAGVVLFCRREGFLGARVGLPGPALAALHPQLDRAPLSAALEHLARVADGDPDAGPLARLEASERFGWLTAPSSTAVQPGPVHTGLCTDPAATLERLYAALVA